MPRTARLDAPGVLHHVMIRGIERRNIFRNNKDRDDFIGRLGMLCPGTQTKAYAWAFLSNHARFLLRSETQPLSRVMRRLLTGYVVGFNHRHGRKGRLFENRYKSIVCQEETYLRELVRYIRLNPIRSGIVQTLDELKGYKHSDHSSLMGKVVTQSEELCERRHRLKRQGYDLGRIAERVSEVLGMKVEDVFSRGGKRIRSVSSSPGQGIRDVCGWRRILRGAGRNDCQRRGLFPRKVTI